MTIQRLFIAVLVFVAARHAAAAPLQGREAVDDVFYQFMPIAWRDSDSDASRFGDFGGMTASLDYLQSLGVTAVWMNPIFPSPAYHGYQHAEANLVNPWFGTEAQFLNFINQAHIRGIKVFIDLVVYGISQNTIYYQNAYNNPASIYDTWLAFTNAANTTYLGSTYTTWNGSNVGFIFWNLNNSDPTNLVTGWCQHWLDPNGDGDPSDGIDGYRLDHVSSNDPTEGPWGYTIGWWNAWKAAMKTRNPDVFTFAEQADWGSYGVDLMSAHDATLTKQLLFAARSAISGSNASGLYSSMATTRATLPAGRTYLGTLGDHDVDRLASAVGGTGTTNLNKCKAAAAVLLTMPFPPVIYYGDEIGMLGTKNTTYSGDAADIPMREPFKWNAVAGPPMSNYFALNSQAYNGRVSRDNDGRSVAEQTAVAGSLLETYRTLIGARKAHIALRRGAYYPVTAGSSSVFACVRYQAGQETLVVAVRMQGTQTTTTLNLSGFSLPGGSSTVQDVISGGSLASLTDANKAAYSVMIPGYRILAINAAPVLPATDVNGENIPSKFAAGNSAALQDRPTSLGDNLSELDQLFVRATPAGLRVGITGNLLTDGTGLALLLDTTAGGQNVLNFSALSPPPGGPDKLTGLKLDAGFAPDHMIFVNASTGSVYVDHYALSASGSASKTYRGAGTVNSGVGTLSGGTNPNGMQVALSNTNLLGVTDTAATAAGTATSGFELILPYADIGLSATPPRGALRAAAFILKSSGEVTSQWLPGLGGGYTTLGIAPDMTGIPGDQYAVVPLDIPGDFNADGYVDVADLDTFLSCASGPAVLRDGTPACAGADLDYDGDVDSEDFACFQRCWSGLLPAAPNCAN